MVVQSMGARQFLFVSSAGIYDASVTPPLIETDAVKFTSGHAEVERYAASFGPQGMQFSSFRPQYIVGSGNNKDCEEYFFDRLVRPFVCPSQRHFTMALPAVCSGRAAGPRSEYRFCAGPV